MKKGVGERIPKHSNKNRSSCLLRKPDEFGVYKPSDWAFG